jgi:prevent-host-death family protein
MTIHVNIGEAKAQLSKLISASLRGEEVVIDNAGKPQVRLIPVEGARVLTKAEIGERRRAAFGLYREAFKGADLSLESLKAERGDPDERFERKFGPAA